MSVVHLALDTALDRPVAVKLLADRLGGDQELRERFVRESRFAAKLSHPNVVAVFDSGEEDGLPYIVMERVDGRSLAEELGRRRRLPPAEVAELGRQAALGLAHAHAAGLVHRDVKPQNLLLDRDGTLKVADFGIARGGAGATLTQAGTLLGTAAYMAPEARRGDAATAASDLWSLGAVLYELLTGRPPRKISSFADLLDETPVVPPGQLAPGTPADLEATILRCLDGDPRRRPASAADLAAELGGSSELPTRAVRPAPVAPRARHGGSPWLLAGAAAVLAAVVVALTLGGEDAPAPPARVEPVPASGSPAQDARNLAAWLRENSG
jgi:eukaryotic-like serine/threonine-protein kinase